MIKRVIEWFKMKRRKEVRIHSKEVRGRVYAKRVDKDGSSHSVSLGKMSVSAVITRADGTQENLGEVARS